ncbi:MAG TPA: outer membrane beta-barrel protein [Mucilaginibacter sp.]|jgi:hypothetical protein|nr:outer membrane beta-barrel protein [Mucilaginibacter sp.]
MKYLLLVFAFFASITLSHAQTTRTVNGSLIDSTKMPIPGALIKLTSDKGDTLTTTTGAKGDFTFKNVKGSRITLTLSSIGYQGLIKHFILPNDTKPADVGAILLKTQTNMLNQVNINGSVPVVFKEDTIEYKADAFKVRDNAPIEDVIRKLPGVDVDANGNVIAQGKQVTKVRVNGKDFFNGDVQSATRNIPADIVDNVQIIDDYGDQANITGVKTGDPTKIMNINIKTDKNHGYTGQATLGDGSDLLPKEPGVSNDNRYVGLLNVFHFNGDQQTAFLSNVNNTNVNTFSFGTPGGPPAASGAIELKKVSLDLAQSGGGKISIGGGGITISGAGGNFTSQSAGQNGITDTHTFGLNYRDQWGKKLSVYGSYSFADNTTFTNTNTLTENATLGAATAADQTNLQTARNINHRFNGNIEYNATKADYFKITPSFSWSGNNTHAVGATTSQADSGLTAAYTTISNSSLTSPNYSLFALYNHKFGKPGRDISFTFTLGSSNTHSYQNPIYAATAGTLDVPSNQQITTDSKTNSVGANAQYLEPLGKYSYLEVEYAFNRSATDNNKYTDVLDTTRNVFYLDTALSNVYNYTFTTNKFSINYHYALKGKYNYTLGVAAEPETLDGNSALLPAPVHTSAFNIFPQAHFSYTVSKSKSISFNYSGSSGEPSFNQLQPVTDFSNALYPVEGNPGLKPFFTNNMSAGYNVFDMNTFRMLFTNVSFTTTQNQITTNTISYPAVYTPNPLLQSTYFTTYLNAGGYYSTNGFISYSIPWDNRKYTLLFNGSISYSHNIGYLTDIAPATYAQTTEENIAKRLAINPGLRFRVDIPEVIDGQVLANYSIAKTDNSVQNDFTNASANVRSLNFAVSGKNYFHDWTISYDYSKLWNYGYASTVHATNPNILNFYVERRFLKDHRATLRAAVFDAFDQNTGFSTTTSASAITQTTVNRLGRYYLLSFTYRLQKFAGKN